MKIFPEHIRQIAVIAPAGIPDINKVKETTFFLTEKGYRVSIKPSIYNRCPIKYLASDLTQRLADIHDCYEDKKIDAIIAVRGGFGSAHLLPHLNWQLINSRNIPLIGFSDITALHLGMYTKKAKALISGPMFQKLFALKDDQYTLNSLYESLNPNIKIMEINPISSRKKFIALKSKKTNGKIIPVTLSVLTTILGTEFLPELSKTILLIEDTNEPVYKLDRYLTQLQQTGILAKISGLLCGSFTRCGNEADRIKLFEQFTDSINGPVILNIPFGHSFPRISVTFGAKCEISADNKIYIHKQIHK